MGPGEARTIRLCKWAHHSAQSVGDTAARRHSGVASYTSPRGETLRVFEQDLEKRLASSRQEEDDAANMRETKKRLKREAHRIADAIAVTGHSQTLIERLRRLEFQIAALENPRTAHPVECTTAFYGRASAICTGTDRELA
jgi:hypothetical protein